MRFAECLAASQAADRSGQGGPAFSIEVYPPKTEKSVAQLGRILPRLVALKPAFMTVTYGAMGTTRDHTLDITARIRREFGVESASHLTCVGATREEIDAILDRLRAGGVENVVALRGDPPKGETEFVPPVGGFAHGNELVEHISGRGDFGIAVAGYPEKHLEAPDLDTDIGYLRQKVDAGADLVVTQLFYDNAAYFSFLDKARAAGITVPIVPGILPALSAAQVRRMAEMCGASMPAELEARLEAAGDDPAAARSVGTDWAIAQCRELLERGAPAIHFYVLNRAAQMEKIIAALR